MITKNQLQTDYKLKEETEDISEELIAEIVYYEVKENMVIKNLEYNLEFGANIGIYKKNCTCVHRCSSRRSEEIL